MAGERVHRHGCGGAPVITALMFGLFWVLLLAIAAGYLALLIVVTACAVIVALFSRLARSFRRIKVPHDEVCLRPEEQRAFADISAELGPEVSKWLH